MKLYMTICTSIRTGNKDIKMNVNRGKLTRICMRTPTENMKAKPASLYKLKGFKHKQIVKRMERSNVCMYAHISSDAYNSNNS